MPQLTLLRTLKGQLMAVLTALLLASSVSLVSAAPANAALTDLKVYGWACQGGSIGNVQYGGAVMYFTQYESDYAHYTAGTNYFEFTLRQYYSSGTDLDLVIYCDNDTWYYLPTIHLSGHYSYQEKNLGWVKGLLS